MEGVDVITDNLAGEGVALLVLERIWSRVHGYLEGRDKKAQDTATDTRLDAIDSRLSEIKGKQDTFEAMLNSRNLKL
jgi:hypothetical protein